VETTKVTTTVAETTITTTTTPVTTATITELVTTLEETTIKETEAITEKLIQETVYIEPKVAVPVTQIEVTIPVVPVTDAPAVTQEIINPPANNTVDYNNMTSLGSLKITGYVATGNKTASGVYPYVGGCAMSRSHGIPFGSTVYVEGLGYYTVNDTGCAYGVVDIFCSTVQECYNLTGNYNVYLVN
jgi:3D (Asp-Asp-Asp) domain-containing protein